MKFIANILTEKSFSDGELYNVVNKKEDLIKGIPTMVIGWSFTHELYPEANIIDWKIDDSTYWTFGKREKRSVYETRLEKFREIAFLSFTKSVKYENLNMMTASNEEKNRVMEDVFSEEGVKFYYANGMSYIYLPKENIVYGISLREIDYIGKNAKEFLSSIYKSENIEGVSADSLTAEVKFAFRNCHYIIPYLMS